jgi:large subunit ribosomal protein L10
MGHDANRRPVLYVVRQFEPRRPHTVRSLRLILLDRSSDDAVRRRLMSRRSAIKHQTLIAAAAETHSQSTMVRRSLLLLPLGYVAGFTAAPIQNTRHASPLFMGGAQGGASSRAGKGQTIEKIKGLLETSEMIFSVPASSVTVKESESLRRSMPQGTTVVVIKNKLMNIALDGSNYEGAKDLLKGANMWFFIEEDISATIKSYKTFQKEKQKIETHPILGGVLEGTLYDGNGVNTIGDLPTKDQLYAQIAGAIKAVPTKVARVIKAPNSKLARAIKLATDEVNKS